MSSTATPETTAPGPADTADTTAWRSRALGAEMLSYLADTVAEQLRESGIEPEQAGAIGETCAEQVRERFGGQVVYVSKGAALKTRQRWQRIWADFSGFNHAELARRYGMGVQGIYRVLAIMRAEHRRRAQPDLFQAQPNTEEPQ